MPPEFLVKSFINEEKCGSCKPKEQKIKFVEEIKNNIGHPNFETLVLVLYRHCGDNIEYGLLSKNLFQRN